jgi:plasmid maintenance system antidote protein VapI
MRKAKLPETMTDVLRRATVESGLTYLELNRATGLKRASLQRFVERRSSLRLDLADRLAQYLGLSLVTNGNRSSGKKRS